MVGRDGPRVSESEYLETGSAGQHDTTDDGWDDPEFARIATDSVPITGSAPKKQSVPDLRKVRDRIRGQNSPESNESLRELAVHGVLASIVSFVVVFGVAYGILSAAGAL